jgi:hypothetical protein
MKDDVKGSGIVRLGAAEGPATWEPGAAGTMIVRFDLSRLTPAQQAMFAGYRPSTSPIELKLPGQAPRTAAVMGFDLRRGTFYVSVSEQPAASA